MILLDDIEPHVRDEERVPKSSNLWLGVIFFAFCFYMMEQTWQHYRHYLGLYAVLGGLSVFFFWQYIVPPKQIHIGVNNDKMIVIHKNRPYRTRVKKFLTHLQKEIEIKKKKLV